MSEEEVAHDVAFIDDDDDMPPLVDNPHPASMTFTFAANMTPIAYGFDQNSLEVSPQVTAPRSFIYAPPPEPELELATTTSHSKKKDASYIPRPPNAFILFRSHFIKAQHIPEKIEGNHSALSKIIGKYWKSLAREERQVWETKAIMALADHRKKYPDWRFRPSSNGIAKVKDGPKRRKNNKARGEAEKKGKNRARRCDKIADLLVAGKTGVDLEEAIEKFDHETEDAMKIEDGGCSVFAMKVQEQVPTSLTGGTGVEVLKSEASSPAGLHMQNCPVSLPGSHDMTPHAYDARFCTPLTSMFRRSSSAPAAHMRMPTGETHPIPYLGRRESFCAVPSTEAVRTHSTPPYGLGHEVAARVEHQADAMFNVGNTREEGYSQTPLHPSSLAVLSSPDLSSSSWDETASTTSFGTHVHSPALPALGHDLDDYPSPVHSPQSSAYDMFSEADTASVYAERATDFVDAQYAPGFSQYSSLKAWAGDGDTKGVPSGFQPYSPPFVVTPQTPSMYDEGIMQNAFDAASYAHLGGWDLGFDQTQPPLWRDSTNDESLQDYARGLADMGCRQGDNSQLFTYALTTN